MARVTLTFAPGVEIKATTVKASCLAIHRSFDKKGFILTHLPTMKCVARRKLQRDALALRKRLDALDWADPEAIRSSVERILDN